MVGSGTVEFVKLESEASFAAAIDKLLADPFLTLTGKKLLGSLCNREHHEGARFYATLDFDALAQISVQTDRLVALNLCVYPNMESTYRQAAEALVEQHLGGTAVLFGAAERTVALPGMLLGCGHEVVWAEMAAKHGFECKQIDCVAFELAHAPDGHLECDRVRNTEVLERNELYLDRLREGDAPLVDKCWVFGRNGKGTFTRNLITNFPSTCVRRKCTHEPVAWCLQYSVGWVGNLYVTGPWRRKGLGSVVASAQVENMLKGNNQHPRRWLQAWVVAANGGGQGIFDRLAALDRSENKVALFRMEAKCRKSATLVGAGY